jgi:hypothetical protein
VRAWNVIAVLVGALLLATPSGMDSCGIPYSIPVFATAQRPADLQSFANGKLGVLRRSYGHKFLIGAFRILSGVPLTSGETESLWGTSSQGASSGNWNSVPGLDSWIAARRSVPVLPTAPAPERDKTVTIGGSIYSYVNCQTDAFVTASSTLSTLNDAWGEQDLRTLDWVRAQDMVFSNCSGSAAVIPAELSDSDPLPAAYRKYQIAAAYFYSGQFRKAVEVFRQISTDTNSPWREWAPYLIARSLLRAGMIDNDLAAFREGKNQLDSIMRNPDLTDWHEPSLGMLHLWQLRVEPRTRFAELSADLMRPSQSDINQTVIDFLYLLNNRRNGAGVEWSAQELGDVERTNELGSWLLSMSLHRPADAPERAVEWWRKKQNPVWLIAALANANERDLPDLLQAAGQISPDAPAYESVAYYAVSREGARGHRAEARRLADQALRQTLTRSARNLILAQRMQAARDWNDFLRYALRSPEPNMEEFEEGESPGKSPMPGLAPVFDLDVIDSFNTQIPLSLWADAVRNSLLPGYMQLRIAEAGWFRAGILGKTEEARSFMQRVGELQPASEKIARSYVDSKDSTAAHHTAAYLMLRAPTLSPLIWAPETSTPNIAISSYRGGNSCWYWLNLGWPQKPRIVDMAFLSAEQRAAAAAEWKQIREAKACGATYVLRQTLDWAEKDSADPRLPEALHRAVMASFYRGTDADTGKYSKRAYELLHKRYPNSEWAIRTKYWYK